MSSQAHERSSLDGRVSKLKPHEMGLQISRRFYSQGPKEGVVRTYTPASWRGVSAIGRTKGQPDRGRPFDARSCAHDDFDSAQNTLCRRLSATSRARAPFIWRGPMVSVSAISRVNISGRGDISSRRLVETKRPYANIFEIRRRKTPAWISSIFSADPPPIGGPIHRGRVSAPFMPL